MGLYKSDLALMGVLLVSLWGSTREDLEVRVGGGGGLGREEWDWFRIVVLDCWGLIIEWVLGLQFERLGFVEIGDHEIVGFMDLMFNFVFLFSELFVIFGS